MDTHEKLSVRQFWQRFYVWMWVVLKCGIQSVCWGWLGTGGDILPILVGLLCLMLCLTCIESSRNYQRCMSANPLLEKTVKDMVRYRVMWAGSFIFLGVFVSSMLDKIHGSAVVMILSNYLGYFCMHELMIAMYCYQFCMGLIAYTEKYYLVTFAATLLVSAVHIVILLVVGAGVYRCRVKKSGSEADKPSMPII